MAIAILDLLEAVKIDRTKISLATTKAAQSSLGFSAA